MNRLLLALFLFASIAPAIAQEGVVRGVVTDAVSGESIPGVNVVLFRDGTTTTLGAASDSDGVYYIANVPAGDYELVASFIGYERFRTTLAVGSGIVEQDVAMREDLIGLDEVVVTGQGGAIDTKRLSTTVDVISAKQLAEIPGVQLDNILQAALPSASVRFNSGLPGTASLIRSRGIVSANSSTTPVIYVDGVRVDNLNSGAENSISTGGNQSSAIADIPIENIERIEFIKGGAATTLYGSDAANGVIQIFTKTGVPGLQQFSFETTQGVSVATRDFLRFDETADVVYRPGYRQLYRLSGTGGGQALTYSFSGSMQDDESYRYGLGERRYNLRTAVGASVLDALRYTGSLGFSSNSFSRPLNSNFGSVSTLGALEDFVETDFLDIAEEFGRESPEYRAYRDSLRQNDLLYNFDEDVRRFQTSHALELRPVSALSSKLTLGLDYRVSNQLEYYWTDWVRQIGSASASDANQGDLTRSDRKFLGLTLELSNQYARSFGDFSTVTTLGGQVFRNDDLQLLATVSNIADGSRTIDTGVTPTVNDFRQTLVNYGVFIAENIGYKDRYFVDLGLRGDGNSAFGEDIGVVWYPKIGASYVLSDESFFAGVPDVALSYLKLRTSYGAAGNFPPPFENERTVSAIPFSDQVAFLPDQSGADDLKPERTFTWEVGADLATLAGRANFEFTYYDARTKDALFAAPFAQSTGLNAQLRNLGEIENRGYELATTLVLTQSRNVDVRLRGSLNHNKNEVVSTGGAPEFNLFGFTFLGRFVKEGLPAGYLRGTKTLRDENGNYLRDAEGNLVVEPAQFLGNPTPSHFGSISLNATLFNRLNLLVASDFQWGGKVINLSERYRMRRDLIVFNQTGEDPGYAEWADPEWKAALLAGEVGYNDMGDVLIASSDFFKVRLISLGYEIPDRYLSRVLGGTLRGLEVRASVQNPFNVVAGPMDPELSGLNTNNQGALNTGGYAYGADALPRIFNVTLRTDL